MRKQPADDAIASRPMPLPRRVPRLIHAFWHRPRLSVALLLGALLAVALGSFLGAVRGALLAFDLASAAYLTSVAWMMSTSSAEAALRRAELHREGRWAIVLLCSTLSAAVLLSLHLVLHDAGHAGRSGLLLAASGIVLGWLFFGVVFAQAYAHADLLARRAGAAALQFPGDRAVDYWDYLYCALTLSMTFQTSDVAIADPRLRRMVLLHSVMAFFFNVVIIAQAVNAIGSVL